MKETTKTAVFLGVAAVLAGTALVSSIPGSRSAADFNDVGQPFFPDFQDPALATTLEVVEFDPETAEPRPFKVTLRDGRWIIPSHSDYPADAKDRLQKTAAAVLGLTRDTIRSNRADDHELLGVVDPLEAKGVGREGVGKRITVRDKSDRVLAEYVVGKDVPDRPGQKFIRRPNQARTYGVNVEVEPSTRFGDWIEPNLLALRADEVRGATFDNSKLDLARGGIVEADALTITRANSSTPWTMKGLKPNEEVDPAKASAMVNALADLKIVGVRPKPPALAAALGGDRTLDVRAARALQRKGFYVTPRGFYSDAGSLSLGTESGINYTLRFGVATFEEGEALSAGAGEDAAEEKGDAKAAPAKGQATAESRYLFVDVGFDPNAIPKPTPPNATGGGELPVDVFAKDGAEKKADADRAKREMDDYTKRVEAAKKRADELAKRFAPWYYLVPGDDYRMLVLDRKTLIHDKPPAGAAPPGNPFGPGANPFHGPGGPPGRLR